jgi:hypothetical protein
LDAFKLENGGLALFAAVFRAVVALRVVGAMAKLEI